MFDEAVQCCGHGRHGQSDASRSSTHARLETAS